MSTPAVAAPLLRVEKGNPEAEELAAITAVLLARTAPQPGAPAARSAGSTAGRRRPQPMPAFRAPHSWQS
ncbi:acyl-CoA carboxylase subunit epsilon [Streptomyces sp. NBC_01296]|uniref:acyl-CoA carboxylase subunit epsilon n=1 Tax=Streptomyces sp. NBC_01296 TaxID=2903816 RepID=UPI002E118C97|nr:acyl-CoA carboxylase subunit epsilon [Streptomyces sp. NBC_01296]